MVTEGGVCRSGLGYGLGARNEPAHAFPLWKAPHIVDTGAIITLQTRSLGQAALGTLVYSVHAHPWVQEGAQGGTQHLPGMMGKWGWPEDKGGRDIRVPASKNCHDTHADGRTITEPPTHLGGRCVMGLGQGGIKAQSRARACPEGRMEGFGEDSKGLGGEGLDFSRPPRGAGPWIGILSTVQAGGDDGGWAPGEQTHGGPLQDVWVVGSQTSA